MVRCCSSIMFNSLSEFIASGFRVVEGIMVTGNVVWTWRSGPSGSDPMIILHRKRIYEDCIVKECLSALRRPLPVYKRYKCYIQNCYYYLVLFSLYKKKRYKCYIKNFYYYLVLFSLYKKVGKINEYKG